MVPSPPEGVGDVLTAPRITGIYVLAGGAWILLSDRLLALLVATPALYTELQTVKGWVFVAFSGLLIFALVRSRERRLDEATEQSDRALRQVSVLHRVVRHNMRNVCNVIQGNTEMLVQADGGSDEQAEYAEAVHAESRRLASLSRKTGVLQDVLENEGAVAEQDVVALLEEQVEALGVRHPGVTVELTVPERSTVLADEHLARALGEVLENAVEHNDRADPTIWVAVDHQSPGTVRIDVGDDGPGIPQMERDVVEQGFERPMFHSEGLGLWLIRSVVSVSGGDVRVVDNEPSGSIVRVTLPAATGSR